MMAERSGDRIRGIRWIFYPNKNLSSLGAIVVKRVSSGLLSIGFAEFGGKVNEINVPPGRAERFDDLAFLVSNQEFRSLGLTPFIQDDARRALIQTDRLSRRLPNDIVASAPTEKHLSLHAHPKGPEFQVFKYPVLSVKNGVAILYDPHPMFYAEI